ncbi:hypothetical protein, partial [Haloechinothrix salitolerans]|uniref:hypothetical protein n=1 Tax=Haloechinothrix salitolerans TaxID=926830 RepID=UPI0035E72C39
MAVRSRFDRPRHLLAEASQHPHPPPVDLLHATAELVGQIPARQMLWRTQVSELSEFLASSAASAA